MSQPSSDNAFELSVACVHGLRFSIGAPVGYPYAPAPLSEENPPPALFRRVQAVSPPPDRNGEKWYASMTLDGEPFQPDVDAERLADVQHDPCAASLDPADPDQVVLDEGLVLARQEKPRTMEFPGRDRGRYLLSISYWNPVAPGEDHAVRDVPYWGEFSLRWSRPPQGDWVALSFDAFWPPERDSADIIVPISACDENCPVQGEPARSAS